MGERPSPHRTPRETSTVARLEDLTKGALVRGVVADAPVTVVDVTWHGSDTTTLTNTLPDLTQAQRLRCRDYQPTLAITGEGCGWACRGDANDLRRCLIVSPEPLVEHARLAGALANQAYGSGNRLGATWRS